MENYKVLKQLVRGSRSCVCLVEHGEEGEVYVLKQMECIDEREAAKACEEVMTLKDLQHHNVCRYKEAFLSWDKEVEAILLCLVMEYYRMGSLDSELLLRRNNRQFVEESVAKKWLGQLIEALHFVHQNSFIHRNLKPSNIFIGEDLSLSLGDFGLSAIMEDTSTVSAAAVGGMNWMAPEILEARTPHYDKHSEVWSLGCIMLDVVTCGCLNQSQISRVLTQMKKDPKVLEDALDQIAKEYSEEMCQVLRSLLRRAHRQRPTISELVKDSFVQECLSLNNSPLCEAKESEEKAPVDAPMCPKNGNLEEVLVYMEEQAKNKRSQFDALRYLSELVKVEDTALTLGDGGKELVLGTMTRFPTSLDIQLSAVEVLASTASQDDLLFSEEGVSPICLAIRSHPNSKQLQIKALSLLASLVCSGVVAEAVGRVGGVQDILCSMRNFPLSPDIAGSCCIALWGLSLHEASRRLIAHQEGVVDLCKSLQQHMSSPEIVDAALSALWSLSVDDDSTAVMSSSGAVETALTALQTHPKKPSIARFGLSLLSSLVDSNEVTAFQIVSTESGCEGVPVILETMRFHLCNTEVIEPALLLLQSCCHYPDICEELTSRKAADVLCCVQKEHVSHEDITSLAGVVASQLTTSA